MKLSKSTVQTDGPGATLEKDWQGSWEDQSEQN